MPEEAYELESQDSIRVESIIGAGGEVGASVRVATGGGGGSSDITVIDDFETDSISFYSGDTGQMEIDTGFAVNGSQSLKFNTPDGSKYDVYSLPGDGLNAYFEIDVAFKCYVRFNRSEDFGWITFANDPASGTPNENEYFVEIDLQNSDARLVEHSGSENTLDSLNHSFVSGDTYEVHGLVESNGDITIDIANFDTETFIGQLTANNSQFTASPAGVGFRINNRNGQTSFANFDYYHKDSGDTPDGNFSGGGGTPTQSFTFQNNTIDTLNDADGIDIADVDGDGTPDIVAANGGGGDVFWYENAGGAEGFTQHNISTGVADQVEGVTAEDIDGDGNVEVFFSDQTGSGIYVATQDGADPTGTWSETQLTTDFAPQKIRLFDITDNGDKDVVFAYEGSQAGEGGVAWLEYDGGDPSSSGSYTRHQAIQREGGWGLPEKRIDFTDDGNADDIAFTCRGLKNSSTTLGLFFISPPADPTNTWTETTIQDTDGMSNVYFGDLTGDGTSEDLLVTPWSGGGYTGMRFYDASDSYSETVVGVSGNRYYTGRPFDVSSNSRDELILCDRDQTSFELWAYDSGEGDWTERNFFNLDKADSDVKFADIDEDGTDEVLTVAAFSNYLGYVDVEVV